MHAVKILASVYLVRSTQHHVALRCADAVAAAAREMSFEVLLEFRGSRLPLTVSIRGMITGSSTHNQRIQRLWRGVTQPFYRLFYHFEHIGLLDPLNEAHLFALHYVLIPRINRSLEAFQRGWNHHSIRTESNKSPHQLFVQGYTSHYRDLA